CHNHKYDPFTQKDYFQAFAILNNSEDANGGNDAPTLAVAAVGKDKEFAEVTARLNEARAKLDEETKAIDARQAEWAKSVDPAKLPKEIADILAQPADKRDKKLLPKVQAYHRSQSPAWVKLDAEVKELTARSAQVGTTTPILRELKQPRVTNVLIRGNFLDRG